MSGTGKPNSTLYISRVLDNDQVLILSRTTIDENGNWSHEDIISPAPGNYSYQIYIISDEGALYSMKKPLIFEYSIENTSFL